MLKEFEVKGGYQATNLCAVVLLIISPLTYLASDFLTLTI